MPENANALPRSGGHPAYAVLLRDRTYQVEIGLYPMPATAEELARGTWVLPWAKLAAALAARKVSATELVERAIRSASLMGLPLRIAAKSASCSNSYIDFGGDSARDQFSARRCGMNYRHGGHKRRGLYLYVQRRVAYAVFCVYPRWRSLVNLYHLGQR